MIYNQELELEGDEEIVGLENLTEQQQQINYNDDVDDLDDDLDVRSISKSRTPRSKAASTTTATNLVKKNSCDEPEIVWDSEDDAVQTVQTMMPSRLPKRAAENHLNAQDDDAFFDRRKPFAAHKKAKTIAAASSQSSLGLEEAHASNSSRRIGDVKAGRTTHQKSVNAELEDEVEDEIIFMTEEAEEGAKDKRRRGSRMSKVKSVINQIEASEVFEIDDDDIGDNDVEMTTPNSKKSFRQQLESMIKLTPPVIAQGKAHTTAGATVTTSRLFDTIELSPPEVDARKSVAGSDLKSGDEFELDPELLQLKENFNKGITSATDSADVVASEDVPPLMAEKPLNVEFRAFEHEHNEIPLTPIIFKIRGNATLERAMEKYREMHSKNLSTLVFLCNGVVITKYATSNTLKATGSLNIDVMTQKFYEEWKEKSVMEINALVSGVVTAEDLNLLTNSGQVITVPATNIEDSASLIVIKLNTKNKSIDVSIKKTESFERLEEIYRVRMGVNHSQTVTFQFDGEKIDDKSQTLEEFDIDEDDQIDVHLS